MDISWIIGRARTSYHHASETLSIPFRSARPATTLLDMVKEVVPPCNLSPFLPGGHLQTLQVVIAKNTLPVHYKRRIFESTHETYHGTFAVDFVSHVPVEPTAEDKADKLPPRTSYFSEEDWTDHKRGGTDDTPMLILLHGLSGGSHELYLKETLWPLINPSNPEDRKWEACVVNARGCGHSKVTSGVIFNARATWDVRQFIRWARETWPNRPLFGMGFSLGANIMVDYLGEEGAATPLDGAVVLSNPWDLHAGSLALQRTWIGKEIYSKTMGGNMRNLFETHLEELSKNPRVNVEKVLATRYLHEFDRELQGPTWGYPTEGAYYRDASSTEPLFSVRVPLLAINAEDDPVCPLETFPIQEITQNPHAILVTTSMGGHLGWFELGGSRWMAKPANNFLRILADQVDLKALRAGRKVENTVPGYSTFDPLRRKLQVGTSS